VGILSASPKETGGKTIDDRRPHNSSGNLSHNRYRIKNAREVNEILSPSAKLRLRFALAIVARVMGDHDQISAMQLKELIAPLGKTNDKFPALLSMLGLHFGSARYELDGSFRLGTRPVIEVKDNEGSYEIILQDAMTWNWHFDNEGPWIFWRLQLGRKEATALGMGNNQVIFVKHSDESRLISKDFTPPMLKGLGKNSLESILATDKTNPLKEQASDVMNACYTELLGLIRSKRIDLETTRIIGSFLAPVRTTKIMVLKSSNADIERLNILYYSLAIFLDHIRMILGDPTFRDLKMSEHWVRLRELMHSSQDETLTLWCRKFLDQQERFLQSESIRSDEIVAFAFLSLNEMMDALNNLRSCVNAPHFGQNILDNVEILEIIHRNNSDMSLGKAMRKYGSMIEIWRVLNKKNPKTLKEVGQYADLTEKTAWKHISTLRKWGAIPSDLYTRLRRQGREGRKYR